MLFMSLCALILCVVGATAHILCGIPKVRQVLDKLLNM